MSIERITRSLALLGRAFNRDVDEFFFEAYRLGLEPMTDDELEYAAKKAIGTCRFMPSPVELLEFVGKEPDEVHYLKFPSARCACGRQLEYAESRKAGICSDCWGSVHRGRERRMKEASKPIGTKPQGRIA